MFSKAYKNDKIQLKRVNKNKSERILHIWCPVEHVLKSRTRLLSKSIGI